MSAIFAVVMLGFSAFSAQGAAGGVSSNAGLFKSGNPTIDGHPATQSMTMPHVEPPETIERARHPHAEA
ncbi:hypothetical protein G6O69_17935 [Pseudenhygromyxa sp. WMMC2535]|uniref:hypothetical protein n=1 Tax=Pseudenhygromyxa sp. WMMC2535 TaxID=2712867 RepID=UPI001551F73D|nr:hypothetical protein [Pseudenhygromyxa sp. WMMC2535]NVB39729.1 hypothetical protein [Pseudenhygromyxa sp. WMMC2535]